MFGWLNTSMSSRISDSPNLRSIISWVHFTTSSLGSASETELFGLRCEDGTAHSVDVVVNSAPALNRGLQDGCFNAWKLPSWKLACSALTDSRSDSGWAEDAVQTPSRGFRRPCCRRRTTSRGWSRPYPPRLAVLCDTSRVSFTTLSKQSMTTSVSHYNSLRRTLADCAQIHVIVISTSLVLKRTKNRRRGCNGLYSGLRRESCRELCSK